jgi:hypothetical protein
VGINEDGRLGDGLHLSVQLLRVGRGRGHCCQKTQQEGKDNFGMTTKVVGRMRNN